MLDRVRRQVEHGLDESVAVGEHRNGARSGCCVELPRPVAECHEALLERRSELAEIDRAEAQELATLGLREDEQVVDVPVHPVELVIDGGDALGPFVRVVVEQIEVPLHDRDRGPQLVRHIVEELALLGEAHIETLDHLVERLAQLGEFVAAVHLDSL